MYNFDLHIETIYTSGHADSDTLIKLIEHLQIYLNRLSFKES